MLLNGGAIQLRNMARLGGDLLQWTRSRSFRDTVWIVPNYSSRTSRRAVETDVRYHINI
jgi:hypothetical protein